MEINDPGHGATGLVAAVSAGVTWMIFRFVGIQIEKRRREAVTVELSAEDRASLAALADDLDDLKKAVASDHQRLGAVEILAGRLDERTTGKPGRLREDPADYDHIVPGRQRAAG